MKISIFLAVITLLLANILMDPIEVSRECVDLVVSKPIVEKVVDSTLIEDSLYNSAIDHIKDYEGYRAHIYIDNDGAETVGYGHHIKDNEFFLTPMTEGEADKLLRCDFNHRIETVEEIHGDTLPYCKKIAITLLLYNIGSTKYRKSTVRKKVDLYLPPDKIWVKYCHYRKDGVMVAHPKLRERREFELKMYNYEPVY